MDSNAISLCIDNALPDRGVNMNLAGNISRGASASAVGSKVDDG